MGFVLSWIVGAAFVVGSGSACGAVPGGIPGLADGGGEAKARTEVSVSSVTDGDTVKVSPPVDGEASVRLIGVDTPETKKPGEEPEPLGEEAHAFTEEVLGDEDVTLEFDEETNDDYGRALAYAYLPDGRLFEEVLLAEGLAQVATFPPNTRHVERLEAAQEKARGAGRGIWGLPPYLRCELADRGNGIGGGC